MDLMKRLARYDTFQKSKDHLQVRTVSGATVSLLACTLMVLLFISEVAYWRATIVEDHLVVDASQGEHDVEIHLDVAFHVLPCKDVNLIVEDSKGMPYDESHVRVTKTPASLGGWGNADPRIARTLSLNPRAPGLSDAMSQPGCRLTGTMRVKKVAGDFHVAAPRQLVNMDGHFGYAIPPDVLSTFNASHTIHRLSFGPAFPLQVNPLTSYTPPIPTPLPRTPARAAAAAAAPGSDGAPPPPADAGADPAQQQQSQGQVLQGGQGAGEALGPLPQPTMWQYHLRVVPTIYEYMYGSRVDSHQYSATDFVTVMDPNLVAMGGMMMGGHGGAGMGGMVHPGAWWKFDFSPIMVRKRETRRSFAQFATSLCAILGGVYALSGIVDQIFYRALESRKAK